MDNAATHQMFTLRDYLATRRTIPARHLDEPGPDQAILNAILTLGVRVPDHGKLEPWRFIVFSGEARKRAGEAFAALQHDNGVTGQALEAERERFLRAPVVVVVVSRPVAHGKIPLWEQELSAGAVCMNIIHGAAAHGLRAQWLTEWVAYDANAHAVMGVKEDEKVAGIMYIGTPTMPPTERQRPDLGAILTHVDR